MKKQDEKNKLFYMECHVAGVRYHEANEVWDKLKVGTIVCLHKEKDNRHDPNAVAIYYCDEVTELCYKIGYIPRCENEEIAKFLEMGYDDIFETRICKISSDAHYEEQLFVCIKILKKSESCG